MESKRKKEKKREVTGSETSSLAGNGSRWQPTREQIEILESVYSAGVKTPSAEQIQQITARLSAYGHIEGKNVFYWFQNTKARRRQKQKQDRLAYLTRFYHHSPPLFAPTYGVVSEAAGFYYYPCGEVDKAVEPRRWGPRECKTLELFPLQPSGRGGVADSYSNYSSVQTNDEYSTCKDVAQRGFIDFFSGNCSSSATETD